MLLQSSCLSLGRFPCLATRWPVRTVIQSHTSPSTYAPRGPCPIRSLIVKYFGLFGGLESIPGTMDFIFHYTMGGTSVRILVASKTRRLHAKTITPLPTRTLHKFIVDSSQPGISSGLMVSRRPIRKMGDASVTEKSRCILMSTVPLEIDILCERQIVHTFLQSIVKGILWEQHCNLGRRRDLWLKDSDRFPM